MRVHFTAILWLSACGVAAATAIEGVNDKRSDINHSSRRVKEKETKKSSPEHDGLLTGFATAHKTRRAPPEPNELKKDKKEAKQEEDDEAVDEEEGTEETMVSGKSSKAAPNSSKSKKKKRGPTEEEEEDLVEEKETKDAKSSKSAGKQSSDKSSTSSPTPPKLSKGRKGKSAKSLMTEYPTLLPTASPTTPSPSLSPTTPSPTVSPTTAAPTITVEPTSFPTYSPTTGPSLSPTTTVSILVAFCIARVDHFVKHFTHHDISFFAKRRVQPLQLCQPHSCREWSYKHVVYYHSVFAKRIYHWSYNFSCTQHCKPQRHAHREPEPFTNILSYTATYGLQIWQGFLITWC